MKLRTAVAGCVLLASTTAFAADHIARIAEVMVSNQGSNTSQFIELEDPNGESFPFTPYSMTLFDGAGTSLGSVSLTVPTGTTRLVVATATAVTQFGLTGATALTITLPVNGQVCFNNSMARIHCFGWGNVTSQIIAPLNNDLGPTPPDGMSVQRVSGTYALGTPTPGAVNTAAVPDSSIDAGVIDAPPAAVDAAPSIDAPTGNPNNPSKDDGCSVGAGASWFGLVGLAALVLLRRRRA
ncbi:MAG: hypothetical protein IPQ07_13210 [Myxococcales bacterium]|nr:hypothetical protein [Myxococcales bacterium]